MAKLSLYGHLKEHFGDSFTLEVNSPAEAVRALVLTLPDFAARLKEGSYRVLVGSLEGGLALDETELGLRTQKEIHIVPVLTGASQKGVGWTKVILGAALIAASLFVFAIPGLQGVGMAMFNVGMTLGLQGISALLSPQAKAEDDSNGVFSNSADTMRQGQPIPLLYGQLYIDFIPISANIIGDEAARITDDASYNSDIGGWNS